MRASLSLLLLLLVLAPLGEARDVAAVVSARHMRSSFLPKLYNLGFDVHTYHRTSQMVTLSMTPRGLDQGIAREVALGFFASQVPHGHFAVDHDAEVQLVLPQSTTVAPETIWGLDRIDQRHLPLDDSFTRPSSDGSGIDIYHLDTGAQSTDQLVGRLVQEFTLYPDRTDEDCNGR